jgi:hypothetical protein
VLNASKPRGQDHQIRLRSPTPIPMFFINNYISYVVIQVPKASCMGQLFYDSNFAALIAILCETNIEQIFEN